MIATSSIQAYPLETRTLEEDGQTQPELESAQPDADSPALSQCSNAQDQPGYQQYQQSVLRYSQPPPKHCDWLLMVTTVGLAAAVSAASWSSSRPPKRKRR